MRGIRLFKGKKFQAGDAVKMIDISGQERHVVGLTNACNEGVLNSYIYTFASKSKMDGGCFPCSSLIKRDDGYVFEEPVYKGGLAAFLYAINKLEMVTEVTLIRYLR